MPVFKRFRGRRIKAGNPNWKKATWWVEFKHQRRRVVKSLPDARTKAEAEDFERGLKEQLIGNNNAQTESAIGFSDFVDRYYLPWARANKQSCRDDESRARVLRSEFGQQPLRQITNFQVERFKSSMVGSKTYRGTPRKGSTVNRYRSLLSRIFSLAYSNGFVDSNPCTRVARLEEGAGRERYLTRDEETRLKAVLVADLAYLLPAVVVALNTGTRQSEMLGLKVGHINFGDRPIFYPVEGGDVEVRPNSLLIVKSKNKRPRVLPLNEELRSTLQLLISETTGEATDPDTHVFSFARNGVSYSTLRRGFKLACDTAEITHGATTAGGITWHDLRHTFATRLREQGVHEMDIMQLTGHSSLSMVSRYAHGTPGALQRAVDSLGERRGDVLDFPAGRRVV